MNKNYSVLVVDDEPGMREFLEIMLTKEGYEVSIASNGEEAIEKIGKESFDLAIVDIQMPGINGIEVLRNTREKNYNTTIIMITAFASHESAIEAMKLGAYDYITKPFKIDEIKLVIKKSLDKNVLEKENTRLKKELDTKYGFENFIGSSNSIQQIFSLINRVSELNVNVLISGESGTGKELVARAVHYSGSRKDGPFIPVNCGAIPETLIESEFFGHAKGAFTGATRDKKGLFEEANGGTIFLDEIGDLPIHLQVKLLRVLEEKKVRPLGKTESVSIDVRIISATNKNLEQEIMDNKFREDLFYRLNVIKVAMPPLRERKDDIPMLALHFLHKFATEMDKKITGISNEALEELEKYHYPGNIRELENIIARCVALETNEIIKKDSLPKLNTEGDYIDLTDTLNAKDSIDLVLGDVEKQIIENALKSSQGNKSETAKILGITLRSLRYRLAKHRIYDEQLNREPI
ncbi:MAG: sigma-54 dependent transcriptional regulator [Thermodesulfobacteriota bacterium]